MKSLQHNFKHLKTGIAGKCSEPHNYSNTPSYCHNNFIANTLVFFTSFTRGIWRPGGNYQAAGSLAVIGTICLMTFSKMISLLPRELSPSPSIFMFFWLWGKPSFWASQRVKVAQVFRIPRLLHLCQFFDHNLLGEWRELWKNQRTLGGRKRTKTATHSSVTW